MDSHKIIIKTRGWDDNACLGVRNTSSIGAWHNSLDRRPPWYHIVSPLLQKKKRSESWILFIFYNWKLFRTIFSTSSSGNWNQIQFLCFNGWGSWSVWWCFDFKWLVKCLFVKLVWKDIDNLIDNSGKNKQNVKENMKSWHTIVWRHW